MTSAVALIEKALKTVSFELCLSSGTHPKIRVGKHWEDFHSEKITAAQLRSMLFELLDSDQRELLLKNKILNGQLQVQSQCVHFVATLHQTGMDVHLSWVPENIFALWPQNAFLSLMRPASLSLLAGGHSSFRTAALQVGIKEVLAAKKVKIAAFLNQEIPGFNSMGDLSVYSRNEFSAWKKYSSHCDAVVVDCSMDSELEEALELSLQNRCVIALVNGTQSLNLIQNFALQSARQETTLWRLAQSFHSSLCIEMLPGIEKELVVACDYVLGTELFRQSLRKGMWNELEDMIRTSGERTQMRTLNQSLFQLVTKRKVEIKAAFEHSPQPEELDHLFKKAGL